MIGSIHQSSLGMLLRCGEQFRRRYLEGEVIPPSVAAGRGTGVHAANKANLMQKIKTKIDLPLADLQDATRDGFVHSFKNGVFIPKEDLSSKNKLLNEGLEDALRCTKVYQEKVAPSINPIGVEERFDIDIGLPLTLAGIMDYQEKPIVGDLKTTKMKWPDGRIDTEIQPTFYSFVHEKEKGIKPTFVYHILIARRGKTGPTSEELQEQRLIPTEKHYNALMAKLMLFCQILQKGVFAPASPSMYFCSPRWCGYHATCPYVGNKLPGKWV